MDFCSWINWSLFFDSFDYFNYLCVMYITKGSIVSVNYLEVMKDNVSICLDSDIDYYHHFKIGDILLIKMDNNLGITLEHGWIEVVNPSFTLDWDKTCSVRLSTASCIHKGVMVDITKNVDRDFKLKQLGI